jgi:phytanoyl-CoA hydroxylase
MMPSRAPRFGETQAATGPLDATAQHPMNLPSLSPAQTAQYAELGYAVLPGFKSASELQAVVDRAQALVEAFDPSQGASRFSTRDRSLVADARLIASADQVHCFFEEEALDAEGRLVVPKSRSINKIGHALHDRDPVFQRFSHGPALAAMAAQLGLQQPQVWQSQVIFKQPHIGGEVGWHQDATFFVTTPHSVTTFWFALEDATLDNGCLWVQPGGHTSPLREQYRCEGGRLHMDRLDPTPWPSPAQAEPLPVAAGTLVVFHGLLPHCSGPNRSPHSRLAYTLHATDGRAAYAPHNWLQRDARFPVRGFD